MSESGLQTSVVVPSKDGRDTIHRALESLRPNAHHIHEVILVESNSPDDYRDLLRRAIDKYAPDLALTVIESGPSSNGSVARNDGIRAATGRHVALLDDDDVWAETRLDRYADAVEALGRTDRYCIFSRMANVRATGDLGDPLPIDSYDADTDDFVAFLFDPSGGAQTSSLFLPTLLAQDVQFDALLPRHQDYDFCLRLLEGGTRFVFVDDTLGTYFNREGSVSSRHDFEWSAQWLSENRHRMTDEAAIGFLTRDLLPAAVAGGATPAFMAVARRNVPVAQWRRLGQAVALRLRGQAGFRLSRIGAP